VKERLAHWIETISNVAIIVFVLVSAAALVHQTVRPTAAPTAAPAARTAASGTVPGRAPAVTPGTRIDVPGINWAGRKKNVVLVLSSTCHFCQEGSAFYRRLVEEAHRSQVAVQAVMPQGQKEATAFLTNMGVSVDTLVSASPGSIGVRGTPTVLLVDGAGKVTGAWQGKLQPERETELLARLAGTSE
jgi:hypothetical protein